MGSIRLNETITSSRLVQKLRTKFPSSNNFDLIEVFNNSVANDPSPPSKALAVIHRSTSSGLPVATNVFTKILDYNNRDFYKWQMEQIVKDISKEWLKECGGGIQLNIHRDPVSVDFFREDSVSARINRYLNRNRNSADKESVEIFSKSTEINGEKNWKKFHEIRFFWDFSWKQNIEISSSLLQVFHTDYVRRIVYTQPIDPATPIDRKSLNGEIQKILRETKCVEGVLLFENPIPEQECNFYHAFTVNYQLVGVNMFQLNSMPLDFKYLIS